MAEIYNVAVQVVELLRAASEDEAIIGLTRQLTGAGFMVVEGTGQAFVSDDQEPDYEVKSV